MMDSGLEPGKSNEQKFKEEGFENVGESVHQRFAGVSGVFRIQKTI